MPRFFFHVVNGEFLPDTDGMECVDGDRVKSAAVKLAGDVLRDQGLKLWKTGRLDMFVVDDQNKTQLRLTFEAEDLTGTLSGDTDTAAKGTG